MNHRELLKRCCLLGLGLLIMAFGVAFSIRANLGTSPISSVPYVVSRITPLSVGTATIAMHCVFILLQILILRRNYQPVQLLQLAVAFAFGLLTDFAVWATGALSCRSYVQQWLVCILGIVLVGTGVSFEVTAGIITVAGEGLVLALTKVLPIRFGNMKIIFDVTLVLIAVILSLSFLHGLYGVREGTLAAAVFVGTTAKAVGKPVRRLAELWIRGAE